MVRAPGFVQNACEMGQGIDVLTDRAHPPIVKRIAQLHSPKKTNHAMKHALWITVIALPLALVACKQKETTTEKMDAGAEKVAEGLKQMGDAAAEEAKTMADEAKKKAESMTEEAKEAVEEAAEKVKAEAEEAADAASDAIREALPEPEEPTAPN